eukprot:771585-Pyramimonas_sp.AAC.1
MDQPGCREKASRSARHRKAPQGPPDTRPHHPSAQVPRCHPSGLNLNQKRVMVSETWGRMRIINLGQRRPMKKKALQGISSRNSAIFRNNGPRALVIPNRTDGTRCSAPLDAVSDELVLVGEGGEGVHLGMDFLVVPRIGHLIIHSTSKWI